MLVYAQGRSAKAAVCVVAEEFLLILLEGWVVCVKPEVNYRDVVLRFLGLLDGAGVNLVVGVLVWGISSIEILIILLESSTKV